MIVDFIFLCWEVVVKCRPSVVLQSTRRDQITDCCPHAAEREQVAFLSPSNRSNYPEIPNEFLMLHHILYIMYMYPGNGRPFHLRYITWILIYAIISLGWRLIFQISDICEDGVLPHAVSILDRYLSLEKVNLHRPDRWEFLREQ